MRDRVGLKATSPRGSLRAGVRRSAKARGRRLSAGGFTLVELMVVVVIIGILALIATPGMRTARDDRQLFDYARRVEQLIHRARARAAGRGAAHLLVAAPSNGRGKVFLFEALDGPYPNPVGNPVGGCKGVNQWADAATFVAGVVSPNARFIDGLDLDTLGINVDADIKAQYAVGTGGVGSAAAIAMCVTPAGTTYVGQGAGIAAAVADMLVQTAPFNSFFEVRLTRNSLGAPVGLQRRVIVAGTAAPRIKSE